MRILVIFGWYLLQQFNWGLASPCGKVPGFFPLRDCFLDIHRHPGTLVPSPGQCITMLPTTFPWNVAAPSFTPTALRGEGCDPSMGITGADLTSFVNDTATSANLHGIMRQRGFGPTNTLTTTKKIVKRSYLRAARRAPRGVLLV